MSRCQLVSLPLPDIFQDAHSKLPFTITGSSAARTNVPLCAHLRQLRLHLLAMWQRWVRGPSVYHGCRASTVVGRSFPTTWHILWWAHFLVNAEPLLDRLATKEKHIKVIRAEQIALSEHCGFYWAADAVEWRFSPILGTRVVLFGCGHTLTLLYGGYRKNPAQDRLMTTTLPRLGLPRTNLKGPRISAVM
jgi:hypothetical protein